MLLQQLFILAVVAMAVLAVTRLVRVHRGREPHLEGTRRLLFVLVFVFVPPIVLGALMQPIEGSRQLPALAWVPVLRCREISIPPCCYHRSRQPNAKLNACLKATATAMAMCSISVTAFPVTRRRKMCRR